MSLYINNLEMSYLIFENIRTLETCVWGGGCGGEEVCEGSIVCVYKEGVLGVLYS